MMGCWYQLSLKTQSLAQPKVMTVPTATDDSESGLCNELMN
jgi:hypothetical protein